MDTPFSTNIPIATINTKNPREAAFLALWLSIREDSFIGEALERWRASSAPSQADFHLAREVAYGVCRMELALDYIAEQLSDKKKLSLKVRERILLRTAVYQYCYLEKVPIYAIANESIEIAKKYCHESYVRFLNAALRRLGEEKPSLPDGDTVPEISVRYSYPLFYVQELIQNYGLEKAEEIMAAGNAPSPTMFRIRPDAKSKLHQSDGMQLLAGIPAPIAVVTDSSLVPKIAASPDYYIQNATSAALLYRLGQEVKEPRRILDLCAAPGGKLIAAHDQFSHAELFANDISKERLKALEENCKKYGIKAAISCVPGQEYTSSYLFDLIILDVPCTNSGVLNKRPEARWRIDQKSLEQLEQLQLQLLKSAAGFLAEEGEIWYLTCSILKRENSRMVTTACDKFGLEVRVKETILPNLYGWDGGFGCALRKAVGGG